MFSKRSIILSLLLVAFGLAGAALGKDTVRQWEVFKIEMTAQNVYSNPYVYGLPDNRDGLVEVTFAAVLPYKSNCCSETSSSR